ncbi:ATP-dependent exodnase (exonuclease V) alpha subunit - helicase superfamily I member [Mucilaginibacter sp. PAMC 26640]|nr:ATP-dependent exodnase (exonuclease V) alpha subunit - helicase superfamily I member [Mucilaginibacter sp. PAMC 26640]
MRKYLLLLLSLVSFNCAYSQEVTKKEEVVFQPGEQITYKLRYGIFTAAEAVIKVENSAQNFEGKPALRIYSTANTSGTFNLLFKVRNLYQTFIDPHTLLPYYYAEDRKEGGYKHTDKVTFDHEKNIITANNGKYPFKGNVFDFLSAYYFARNIDVANLKINQTLDLRYFLEDGIHTLTITYLGKEKISCGLGTFNCLKFNPTIIPGRIFKKNSKLYLWITDDKNRIPVKAHVELIVGSLVMDLTQASGLKYPLNPVKK